MPNLGSSSPYYGGGQVANPSNVTQIFESPPVFRAPLGSLAIDNADSTAFIAVSEAGGNTTWGQITTSAQKGIYPISPYVVGPIGQAGYQTIQSAINAANAAGGGAVYVQAGAYTENLVVYTGVDVIGVTAIGTEAIDGKVIVNGNHTFLVSINGSTSLANIAFYGLGGDIFTAPVTGREIDYTFQNCQFFSEVPWNIIFGDDLTNQIVLFDSCRSVGVSTYGTGSEGGTGDVLFTNCQGIGTPDGDGLYGFRTAIILDTLFNDYVGGYADSTFGAISSLLNLPLYLQYNFDILYCELYGEVHLDPGEYTGNFSFCTFSIPSSYNIETFATATAYSCSFISDGDAIVGPGNISISNCSFPTSGTINSSVGTTYLGTQRCGQIFVGSDSGVGSVGSISLTNSSDAIIGAGTGSVAMSSANPATNSAWVKIYIGATAYWMPVWSTNAP